MAPDPNCPKCHGDGYYIEYDYSAPYDGPSFGGDSWSQAMHQKGIAINKSCDCDID